jgi:hypothetical protein
MKKTIQPIHRSPRNQSAKKPVTDEVRALLPLAATASNSREVVAWPWLTVE